ncbi:hypothetical protein HPB50_022976 [Hyalomma asiaticum]|uniref:Uncharacterized protein n=1 Tax=Hyalomma asiaticum TaxID=266040 RepID=A0ACB7SQB8_HYAAI|nr:hypothetical protein HPB50_022976 [Hyalomma asiaticum]
MTEADIEKVCQVLSSMSEEEIRSLHEADIWWLPDIASVSKDDAITSIRNAMISLDSIDAKTLSVAWIYCCLAERNHVKRWRAHFLDERARSGRFTLHERLVAAMAHPGTHTKYEKIERPEADYVCILSACMDSHSQDHDFICLCIPRELPYVFVHYSGNKDRLRRMIGSVLQDFNHWYKKFLHLRHAFDYASLIF